MGHLKPQLRSFHARLTALAATATAPWVTRFAPSPTGHLHLGHVVSALFVWGVARRLDAALILRIEDHDRGRSRAAYEAAILVDLDWLGFVATEGVRSVAPSRFRQSDRYDDYLNALNKLKQVKDVYACQCSRKSIQEARPFGIDQSQELRYPGTCRDAKVPIDSGVGIRLVLESSELSFHDLWLGILSENPAEQCGDLLLRDREGNWTYQFAVVVDDFLQGVNLVIRGQDLKSSTARQIVLGEMLGRNKPAVFCHHPLLTEKGSQQKLSKRQFSQSIAALRAEGLTAEDVLGLAAFQAGLVPNIGPRRLSELLEVISGG